MKLELSEADLANLIMLIDAADIKGRDAEVIYKLKQKIQAAVPELVEPEMDGHREDAIPA